MARTWAGRAAGWLLASALAAPAAHASGFKGMAKELAKAAERAGIRSVAVVSFEPADLSNPREGWSIAEKLTTQIVRQKRVQAVERNLIAKLMKEQFFGETGAVEPAKLRSVGRLLAVDALVTGSFVGAGNEAVVDARLIDARSGAILAAVERRTERDWFDPLGLEGKLAPMPLDPYAFGGPDGEPPLVPPSPPESLAAANAAFDLRDALVDDGCGNAAARVDALEEMILELKARYWAGRLRDGLSMKSVRFNPGSTITDPFLKRRFYDAMKRWYSQSSVPELSAFEVQRFTTIDQKAFQLHRECGL